MIRLGNRIRLTPGEKRRWAMITGFSVPEVRTLREMDSFVEACKRYHDGHGQETELMHFLIDRERARCFTLPDGQTDGLGQ